MQREFSHEITVARSLSEALPLFTPRGEEEWVPGWKPEYIDPKSGDTQAEMLFVTSHGNQRTFWTCLAWQPGDGHVRYLKITPDSQIGFVDVQCRSDGPDKTIVRVMYQLNGLSDSGLAHLNEMTEASFAEMIDHWARLIEQMPSDGVA